MRAARRCPSPAAPRMRPSSTAPSAPPTGSALPPRPRPSPPHPTPLPPLLLPTHRTRAQRRASRGGAPLSLQGVDRPKLCPERQHWSAVASCISVTNRGKRFSLSFSLDCTVFNLFLFGLFYVLVHFVLHRQCFWKCNVFSGIEDKRTGTLGVRCKTHVSEMFLYLCELFINLIYFFIWKRSAWTVDQWIVRDLTKVVCGSFVISFLVCFSWLL